MRALSILSLALMSLAILLLTILAPACGGGGGTGPSPAAPGTLAFVLGDQALFFDGVDDQATITKGSYFITTAGISMEAWIRPQTLVANPSFAGIVKAGTHILTLSDTTAGNDQTSFLQTISTPSTDNARAVINSLQAGVWQHVAGTYDGTTIRVYLNGSLMATKAHAGTASGLSVVTIGSWGTSFHGLIDEVRIWDHARSGVEITGGMLNVLPGSTPGLLAYYRFEGSGQTVTDTSAGGADGFLGGGVTVEAIDPTRQAH